MRQRLTRALLPLGPALAALPAYAQTAAGQPGYWHDGWGGGHMFFGGLMMILFWGIIIVGAILIIRYFTPGYGGNIARQGVGPLSPERDPIGILRERYAEGEIDIEEFAERKRILEDGG